MIVHQTPSCTRVYKDFCTKNQTRALPTYTYGYFLSIVVHREALVGCGAQLTNEQSKQKFGFVFM